LATPILLLWKQSSESVWRGDYDRIRDGSDRLLGRQRLWPRRLFQSVSRHCLRSHPAGVFVAGLCLILAGIIVRRSYLDATKQVPTFFPEVSLKDPMFRQGLDFVTIATVINFAIVGAACYRGIAYMDTVSFCGATCHVMKPEFSAYHGSPHSGVPCTQCHVVPGPVGYAHVKLNGTKQMLMTLFHDYPKPIMAEDKVPAASSTCLNCHDAKRFIGDTLKVNTSFADDEGSTKTSSLTLVHVGGSDAHQLSRLLPMSRRKSYCV
jgi:nitrate/TMAO reductase-like tetraheme cytochrome c subunit